MKINKNDIFIPDITTDNKHIVYPCVKMEKTDLHNFKLFIGKIYIIGKILTILYNNGCNKEKLAIAICC